METIKSYKDLIVWQKSFQLCLEVYKLTRLFPKTELYGLVSQMRRAAISIPSNIAEGCTRKNRKEYAQFVSIAYSSAAELETQIRLAKALNMAQEKDFIKTEELLNEVMRMLNVLVRKLNC